MVGMRTVVQVTASVCMMVNALSHTYLHISVMLMRQGADTGAGMVVFDSPVTVATVVPDVGTHDDEIVEVCGLPSLG